MEDRVILDSILTSTKSACDLMMHGAIESPTENVHCAFKTTLDDCLCMQKDIYAKMSAKGWYPTEQAEQTKIEQAKQKFSNAQ